MLKGVAVMNLELPKNNVVFGNMGEVKNGILYIYRLNMKLHMLYMAQINVGIVVSLVEEEREDKTIHVQK